MRTAVVRVRVDQAGELTAEQLGAGMTELATLAAEAGAELIENNLAALPPSRREVELLMTGMDPEPLTAAAIDMLAVCSPVSG